EILETDGKKRRKTGADDNDDTEEAIGQIISDIEITRTVRFSSQE
ncbi:unnamed protein product, partial [Medioppia subpectinata]